MERGEIGQRAEKIEGGVTATKEEQRGEDIGKRGDERVH
jgi:hypothetical protein